MKIDLTGHHVEITEALRSYVEEKFQRLERHFDNVVDIHVILTVEKNVQKAETTIALGGARLFAEATAEQMYAAIDALIDKADRQVIRHKEKRTDHHREEGRVGTNLDE